MTWPWILELRRHNSLLTQVGYPVAVAYRSMGSFEFGDGRMDQVHFTADAPVAIAGRRGMFTTLSVAAHIPFLLRNGALKWGVGRRI